MRNFILSLAVVAMLAVAGELRASAIFYRVTPDNIDKQPLALSVNVKDVKEGKEFEITVKPKAGQLPPRFLNPHFNVLQEDPKITAPTVKRVDRDDKSVVFSFQIPQKDLEAARFDLYNMAYVEKKDENGKTEFVGMPSADVYRFFLKDFASSPLGVEVKPQKDEVRVKEPFEVHLRVVNSSKSVQSFQVMNCSWDEHWKSSNDKVSWIGWDCPKNFAVTVKLEPGQAYEKTLKMLVLAGEPGKKVSFKMGFTPIESKETYWSDEVSVKVKADKDY